GGLLRAELQDPKNREQVHLSFRDGLTQMFTGKEPFRPQVDMATPVPGQPLPLAVSIAGSQPHSESLDYNIESTGDRQVSMVGSQSGWEVSKAIEWSPDGLYFSYSIAVKNVGSQPASGELGVHYLRAVNPALEEKPSFFGGVGNLSAAECRVGDDLRKALPDDKPPADYRGPINFFGVDQQYFLGALFPLEGSREGRCTTSATPTMRSVVAHFPIEVMPGQTVVQRFGAYVGPKEMDALTSAPTHVPGTVSAAAAPHLEKTVDFGIWAFICNILLFFLKFFYRVFGNWGVAIIGLTFVVKVALMPLTHKAMVSGEAMKKLQPRIEEIRRKYAQDKERQNLETMKLYQEAKVNPLGGCLPMLVQMPVWIALFTTLRNSYEIYGEPFIRPFWVDLTYKDPTYILPLLLCVTMIVTQKLQPQMMDAAQARVMTYVMPVFFSAIILNYPAGLSLYILTNNILSIAQQYGLKKYLEKRSSSQKIESREQPKRERKEKDRKEKKDERQKSSLDGRRASR
ncbi:MAG TPA: membrane protein insertase YidC, partial [Myxococcaceae bacterium]|nr:membrane protein insertase YidC [Myxococcaceae bacterium]